MTTETITSAEMLLARAKKRLTNASSVITDNGQFYVTVPSQRFEATLKELGLHGAEKHYAPEDATMESWTIPSHTYWTHELRQKMGDISKLPDALFPNATLDSDGKNFMLSGVILGTDPQDIFGPDNGVIADPCKTIVIPQEQFEQGLNGNYTSRVAPRAIITPQQTPKSQTQKVADRLKLIDKHAQLNGEALSNTKYVINTVGVSDDALLKEFLDNETTKIPGLLSIASEKLDKIVSAKDLTSYAKSLRIEPSGKDPVALRDSIKQQLNEKLIEAASHNAEIMLREKTPEDKSFVIKADLRRRYKLNGFGDNDFNVSQQTGVTWIVSKDLIKRFENDQLKNTTRAGHIRPSEKEWLEKLGGQNYIAVRLHTSKDELQIIEKGDSYIFKNVSPETKPKKAILEDQTNHHALLDNVQIFPQVEVTISKHAFHKAQEMDEGFQIG